MYNVNVQLSKTDTPLPAGVAFGGTNLVVTDAAGVAQKFALNGNETPPWSQNVSGLADGTSSYSAQDVDTAGNAIGTGASATFTPAAVNFPATGGITVTQAP
jgi:hypothetical protein